MKKLILLILILAYAPAHAEEKPFLNGLEVGALGVVGTMAYCALGNHATDKGSHCYGGLIPGVWGTIFSKKAYVGAISGCAIGLLKEVADHNKWTGANAVADREDFGYTCGAATISAYFTGKIVAYQHKLDTGNDMQSVKKPNVYFGVKLAFSTGQY